MEMIKDSDYINVYMDYDYIMHMPTSNPLDGGYELQPKIDGEPYYVSVLWKDVMRVNPISEAFKKKIIRFEPDMEEQAYRQLRIDFKREKNSYARDEIEEMILHPNDEVLQKIVDVDKLTVINAFLSQLVYLKNTNKYMIAEKVELYIRARKEELQKGLRKSELVVDKTENVESNVELGVADEDVQEDNIVEKPKKGRTSKTK
ncbi:UNVERIFIED_ORG: hypothetical protein B2H93_13475 [Clostridium botulinum]